MTQYKEFCHMEHRGEILGSVLKELGVKKNALAKRLSRHANTITNYIERPDLPDSLMLELGNALGYDFSHNISDLKKYKVSFPSPLSGEPEPAVMKALPSNVPDTLPACQLALLDLQSRHIALLEQHLQVLEKLTNVA